MLGEIEILLLGCRWKNIVIERAWQMVSQFWLWEFLHTVNGCRLVKKDTTARHVYFLIRYTLTATLSRRPVSWHIFSRVTYDVKT